MEDVVDAGLTLTVEETGKLLRIGRNQAYEAVRSGQIPSIRIGKRRLVPREALKKMLELKVFMEEAS